MVQLAVAALTFAHRALSLANWTQDGFCGRSWSNGDKSRLQCAGINRHEGVSSEGWRIQWEAVPPGEKSGPCSLDSQEEGNRILKTYRRSHRKDGERVIGPQRVNAQVASKRNPRGRAFLHGAKAAWLVAN